MSKLSVAVLGPLRVTLDGAPVGGFEYTKVRALLAYLAVEAARPHTRAELCALLWPDLPERAARRNLTQALSALRRAFGDGAPWLLTGSEVVQVDPAAPPEVDASRFAALLAECERHPHRGWRSCRVCGQRLAEAAALYGGDFLAQLYVADSAPFEEWAQVWREQLRQRAITTLERLAQQAEWRGEFAAAAECARRLAALDPLREASQRELLRLLALDGQLAAAEAQFEHLRRTLADELGVEPEAATLQLHARLRAGERESLRRHAPPAFNGPAAPNALIGRRAELEGVGAQLRAGAARALTITGPPGMGKTRLALEAAQALRFDFEDGVHFVELAPVADAAGVAPALARALGVDEQAGKPLAARLAAWLRPRHALLVLDNFEHVLDAAPLAGDLLAAAPDLRLLVTSRAPLRLRSEQQYPLPPLALPNPDTGAEAAEQAEAVQFFLSRARAVRPDFALTPENADALFAICARLDGLPLALELIAARVRTLSPQELLRQLEHGLGALAHSARDLPARHQTLRGAIEWSCERLRPEAWRTLEHLGVFAGGCTLEAAQAVTAGVIPADGVLPALETLHDASLLQTQTLPAETRFVLLEPIREYALETLAARGEAEAARRRHAEHYTGLAEQAEPELIGPEQARWFQRLDRELPNLRLALGWSQERALSLCLRLAASLAPYWNVRGLSREGRGWLKEALRREQAAAGGLLRRPGEAAMQPADSDRDRLRAGALLAAGRLASQQGDHAEAGELLAQSRALYERLEEPLGLAFARLYLGATALNQADYALAEAHARAALDLARANGHWYAEASALNGIGHIAVRRGDYARAYALQQEALRLHEAQGDHRNAAGLTLNLGVIAFERGELQAARRHSEAALAVGRELGDQRVTTLSLLNLGNVLRALGDLPGARACLQETISLQRAQGDTEGLSAPLGVLGHTLFQLGELRAARDCQAEALRLRLEAGDRRGMAVTIENIARLEHAEGRAEQAARLVGAAAALREAVGAPIIPARRAEHEQFVAALQSVLGEAGWAAAWEAGHGLSQAEAAALAFAD